MTNNNAANNTKALSSEELQDRLYWIGEAEEEAAFAANEFASYLSERGIRDERSLKEWAVKQLLWESDWPGPRTIWQAITRGETENEGKKTHWRTYWKKENSNSNSRRVFFIEWGKEFALHQEFPLALVAGLGKVAGVIASRKKRSSSSTVPDSSTASSTANGSSNSRTVSNTASSTKEELEKIKTENSTLYKEIESLRTEQAKAYDKAKQEFATAIKEAENREILAGKAANKAKEQAESMDKAIIAALSILGKAKSTQGSTELFALIEEAKRTLGNAPKMTLGIAE